MSTHNAMTLISPTDTVGQLYYTSCRYGLGQGHGFQVQARSEGISASDMGALVRGGLHTPPRAGFCPKAFRYFSLPSGAWAAQVSTYVGEDYSGREGNFFTHSLVFSPEHATTFILPDPLRLTLWEGWVFHPGPDTEPIGTLPSLSMELFNSLSHQGDASAKSLFPLLHDEALAGFIRANFFRQDILERLLTHIVEPNEVRTRLIVQDDADNAMYWIAALWHCLTEEERKTLSLSSYQGEPGNQFDIMATTPETRFDVLPAQVYTLCDLVQHVGIPEKTSEAAAARVRKLLARGLPLESLHQALQSHDNEASFALLRRLHAGRYDFANHMPWACTPLQELSISFIGTNPKRLCALLLMLTAKEGQAWLAHSLRLLPLGVLDEALPLLATIHEERYQSVQAWLSQNSD